MNICVAIIGTECTEGGELFYLFISKILGHLWLMESHKVFLVGMRNS